jgi:osmotically inducible protein OsmC
MPVRTAESVWEGNLRDGRGTMKMASGAYEGDYSWTSRFEEGAGTNPEELIAAAHSGCFSMAFSGDLGKAGFSPRRVHTTARVHVDKVESGWKITTIELDTEGDVPGIDEAKFQEIAEGAKKGCPVSQLVTGANIKLTARLVGR